MPSKKLRELKRMLTNYRAPPESITTNTRDTLCFWSFFRAKDQENWTECERIVWPTGKRNACFRLDAAQKTMKTQSTWTNCRAHPGSIVLNIINTSRNTLCFRVNVVEKTKKTEKNEKELSGSPGKSRFVTILTLLQTLDVFRLDVVQKTKKTDENVKESSGSPEKKFIQNLTMTEWRLEGPNPP